MALLSGEVTLPGQSVSPSWDRHSSWTDGRVRYDCRRHIERIS